ncbi:N-acetyl-6-hydroxytryptophan oxidase ivoB [Penicillium verhagenii]|nr:N-acetyl-6-hydroxytryptophan oxidase ivoB [Penicillium verhagenii]
MSFSRNSGEGKQSPKSISGCGATIPRGSGGGYALSGRSKKTIRPTQESRTLFPQSLAILAELPEPGFDNPPTRQCLSRNLSDWVFYNATIVSRLTDTNGLQVTLDHWSARPKGVLGVHPEADTFSRDTTLHDLFAYSQDFGVRAALWMIGRVWAQWQDADDMCG